MFKAKRTPSPTVVLRDHSILMIRCVDTQGRPPLSIDLWCNRHVNILQAEHLVGIMSHNSMGSNGTRKTACLDKPMVGKYKINTGPRLLKGVAHILSSLEGSNPSRWLRSHCINTGISNAMDMNRQGRLGQRLNALTAVVQTA